MVTSDNQKSSRDERGRFTSRHLSQEGTNQIEHGRIQKRKEVQCSIFERFMKVFFLPGDKNDFIPCTSKGGPFVAAFENIIKSSYTLGRTTRSQLLQEYYKDQKRPGLESKIIRKHFRDARNPKRHLGRVHVYTSRRLPDVSRRREEIEPLRRLLEDLEGENVLKGSPAVAYEECCRAMGTYRTVAGRKCYWDYPASDSNAAELQSSTADRALVSSSNPDETSPDTPSNNAESITVSQVPLSVAQNVDQENDNEWIGLPDEARQSMPPATFQPSPRSARDFRQAVRLLDIANSNSIFEVLCRSLDDETSKFHLMANPFLMPSMGEPKVANVLKDALHHCQGKVFKIKKEEELQKIEENLKEVKEDLEMVRRVYALKRLRVLDWSFR